MGNPRVIKRFQDAILEASIMIRFHRQFDPQKIRLGIFDLDGTLIDSRLDLVHSVNAALRHIGRPELPEDVIASYVGDGAPTLIRRALGAEADDDALVKTGLEFFLSYYREHKLDYTTVYDGMGEALRVIQGRNGASRKMAVLTNKPVRPSVAIVEALGLATFFSAVDGGHSFAPKKPAPRVARDRSRCRGYVDGWGFACGCGDCAQCGIVVLWGDVWICAAYFEP